MAALPMVYSLQDGSRITDAALSSMSLADFIKLAWTS
jgi:hypothetical protein